MRKFIDKNCNANLVDGLEYYAAGLIVGDHTTNGNGSLSGKDYAVEFIDPWGNYQHEWRAAEDIVISSISESNYEYLKVCYAVNLET